MTCFEIVEPEQKKQTLMQLIDDMTASAIDRSPHGYTQFLHYRSELTKLVDSYAEEDRKSMNFVKTLLRQIDEYFPQK